MNTVLPVQSLYLSHGGGPLPLLGDPAHAEMTALLRELAPRLGRPRAIVLVSGHWEAPAPTLTAGARPGLIYDYYGFPPESYRLAYPAPGAPALAEALRARLRAEGFAAVLDAERGFDHGMFVPLTLLFPAADIPCVQLSLMDGLDPGEHLRLGAALASLKDEGVLLIGSGQSFHNLRELFSPSTGALSKAEGFEAWLEETCTSTALDETERARLLAEWTDAPNARFCHPREEHLLPLHVCYGAAARPALEVFTFAIMDMPASAYLW